MVLIQQSKRFVYGNFFISSKKPTVPPPPTGNKPYAIEILREFAATEFIGKLYRNTGSTWVVATWSTLGQEPWFGIYDKIRAAPFRVLHFSMEGSGVWEVQVLRDESDETGSYIAVGLKV